MMPLNCAHCAARNRKGHVTGSRTAARLSARNVCPPLGSVQRFQMVALRTQSCIVILQQIPGICFQAWSKYSKYCCPPIKYLLYLLYLLKVQILEQILPLRTECWRTSPTAAPTALKGRARSRSARAVTKSSARKGRRAGRLIYTATAWRRRPLDPKSQDVKVVVKYGSK